MDAEFLRDPLTFRHFYDVNGGASLSSLLLSRYLGGAGVEQALSLMSGDGWQDRELYASGVFRNLVGVEEDETLTAIAAKYSDGNAFKYCAVPNITLNKPVNLVFAGNRLSASADPERLIESAHSVLGDGGLFVYVGYCGPAAGRDASDRDAIGRFLRGLPSDLRHPEAIGDDYIRTVLSCLPSGIKTFEAIGARFRNAEVFDMGGLLSFVMWKATRGLLSYDRDDHVALVLLPQLMDLRLIQFRILSSAFKLVVAKK